MSSSSAALVTDRVSGATTSCLFSSSNGSRNFPWIALVPPVTKDIHYFTVTGTLQTNVSH